VHYEVSSDSSEWKEHLKMCDSSLQLFTGRPQVVFLGIEDYQEKLESFFSQ